MLQVLTFIGTLYTHSTTCHYFLAVYEMRSRLFFLSMGPGVPVNRIKLRQMQYALMPVVKLSCP